MKIKIVFILLCCLALYFTPHVFAKNVEVVGKVENTELSTSGSSIIFKDTSSQKIISTVHADLTGMYATSIPEGEYDISVVPPVQSGLVQVNEYNQHITADSQYDFIAPSTPKNSNNMLYVYLLGAIGAVVLVVGYFFLIKKRL